MLEIGQNLELMSTHKVLLYGPNIKNFENVLKPCTDPKIIQGKILFVGMGMGCRYLFSVIFHCEISINIVSLLQTRVMDGFTYIRH